MKDKKSKTLLNSGLLACSLALTACAGTPVSTSMERLVFSTQMTAQPAADYDVIWAETSTTQANQQNRANFLNGQVYKILTKTGAFPKLSYAPPGKEKEKYHLAVRMTSVYKDAGSATEDALGGFITGGSLGIIPTVVTTSYTLTIVVSKDRQAIKTYDYKEDVTRTDQFFSSKRTTNLPDMIDSMLLSFLHDLEKDHLFVDLPEVKR